MILAIVKIKTSMYCIKIWLTTWVYVNKIKQIPNITPPLWIKDIKLNTLKTLNFWIS